MVSGVPLSIYEGESGLDAVHLIRYLERAPNPVAELTAARRLLNPRGLLYLDIGRDGPWTITIDAARRLIEAAGFRVVRRFGRFTLNRRAPLRLLCRRY